MAAKEVVQMSVQEERLLASKMLAAPERMSPGVGDVQGDERFSNFNKFTISKDQRRGMDEDHILYMDKVFTLMRKLTVQKYKPVTILNMTPEKITGRGTLTNHIFINPCPTGKEWVRYVHREVLIDRRTGIDKQDEPVAVLPIEVAYDFQVHYAHRGGLVVYEGDHDPLSDKAVIEKIKEEKLKLVAYARTKKEEADSNWNDPSIRAKGITNIDRAYAIWLLNQGEISEKPAWIELTKAESNRGDACERCGKETIKGTFMCSACAYITDPRMAYEKGEIDIENPALQRLDRAVLAEMKISELIEETVSERQARMLSEAAARRKGKSPEVKPGEQGKQQPKT